MIDGAEIIAVDIECSNGVIHVIDAVMIPPPPFVIPEIPLGTKINLYLLAGLIAALVGIFSVFFVLGRRKRKEEEIIT